MINPREVRISDYSYTLPSHRIAEFPLEERDASRLLVYDDGKISRATYRQLGDFLPANSLLVFNNTRVVEARLLFQKSSGGVIEIFCLEPGPGHADIQLALQTTGSVHWKCLVGGASKWKRGLVLEKKVGEVRVQARFVERLADAFLVELQWTPQEMSFAELLHHAGAVPLPPYIHRKPSEDDSQRYQTIYAQPPGSVAAPTAGLHFTDRLLQSLREKGITEAYLTLHVGAGTFIPVKSETIGGHDMHREWITISRELLALLKTSLALKMIIAVGTTSLRTLESIYWLGASLHRSGIVDPKIPAVSQWEPYNQENRLGTGEALDTLLAWMELHQLEEFVTQTGIIIVPGYRFRLVQGLVTNFHQPQSTLLLLVAALIGDDWKKIYEDALENGFRFLSYGDGSLLLPKISSGEDQR